VIFSNIDTDVIKFDDTNNAHH